MICPTCRRAFRKPSTPTTTAKTAEGKLAADKKRAQAAIDSLAYAQLNVDYWGASCIDAMASEVSRLRQAIDGDHRLLWSIYRRADKSGISYAEVVI